MGETRQEKTYRERMEKRRRESDVEIPLNRGDAVKAYAIRGIPESALESVGGYPVRGEVISVRFGTPGCRNLMCDAVITVRFTEDECPAVYGGTTAVYPVGGIQRDFEDLPLEPAN